MGFEAKVILASVSPSGHPITTMQLKYPRFIHAEFMTHREFSRNASSSRAIPVAKMIEQVRNDPAMPLHWGMNQPGMQASLELGHDPRELAIKHWRDGARDASELAGKLADLGLHKQVANRILEPFQWMHVIMTTTSFTNFDGLRRHADAQPEIKHLADLMAEAREGMQVQQLECGDWHLPYIDMQADWEAAASHLLKGRITRDMPSEGEIVNVLIAMSAARCARVSYLTHDGEKPTVEKDLELYQRLAGAQPIHASPLEHQATPDLYDPRDRDFYQGWANPEEHGNLTGWRQFRKMAQGEYISE